MIGQITSDTPVSKYQPSKEVAHFTEYAQKDYQIGDEILNRPWVELNNRSVIEDMNRGQKTFNAFVDESVENPNDAWKWRGTRSKARNKAIGMHTQITARYIFPSFMAQNEHSEEDRDFSDAMADSVEWLGRNSNYRTSYLMTCMGMLTNPVSYMGAEWYNVYQTVKEKTEKGYTKKEIYDEVLSGFNAPVYSSDQILISNAYEQNIQRQRVVFKRRWIEYSEAEAKYGEHENWEHVSPGSQSVFNQEDSKFYDVKDDDHPNLVQEVTPMYRQDDTEVCFLGGIYMGDTDVEANPMKHRDNRGAPKYNIVPFGYQRINEHFFFYKSLMNAMYWDNQLADAQYELAMNTAFLVANMPTAVYGTDKVDGEIMFPSAVVPFKDKDARVEPLLQHLNPGALFQAFAQTEQSMNEASVSEQSMGQLPATSTKATAIAVAERNAKVMLQGVGKTIAESVVQYGGLMADIVINNLSAAQVDEIVGDNVRLKYRTLVLKNKMVGGKQADKTIQFDEALLGMELSEDEKREENLKLLEKTGYPDNKNHIYRINPELFARMKYLTVVEPEELFTKNEEWMQAIYSQVYAQYSNNPYISLEALTRKSLYPIFRGETEEIMKKQEDVMAQAGGMMGGGAPETTFGQQGMNSKTAQSLQTLA